MRKISVELKRGDHRYDVLIEPGLCRDWRGEIDRRMRAEKYLVMADSRLAPGLGLPRDETTEGKWGCLHVEPGESNKTLRQYQFLCEKALGMGMDRKSVVVAIGGGVTGDIAGFVAATIMRGVRLAMIPTTLLSMVDSSIGGKNGVNARHGKNLVGTFHQPDLVLIDTDFLASLPRREYLAGLAEAVKCAVIESREFFFELDNAAERLLAPDRGPLPDIIARCCRTKAAVVAADEREAGGRALLNYGHTFGHALEAMAGYDGRVVHGEAVAVGMVLAADFAVEKGLLEPGPAADIRALLQRLGLPTEIGRLGQSAPNPPDWRALMDGDGPRAALLTDKKNSGGAVTLTLPRAIGDCRVKKGFDAAEVAEFMRTHS